MEDSITEKFPDAPEQGASVAPFSGASNENHGDPNFNGADEGHAADGVQTLSHSTPVNIGANDNSEPDGATADGAQRSEILLIDPAQLKPHPVNAEIYGEQPGVELVESIRQHGILQPLLRTPENVIIAGHKRRAGAVLADLKEVPVVTVYPKDKNAAIDMLLAANRQRVKTKEQIGREVKWQMKIERQKARKRQATAIKVVPAKSPEASGDARDIVAKKLGIGGKKVDQYVAVVEKLDELDKRRDKAEAGELRRLLEKSVNKAARRVGVLDAREKNPVTALQGAGTVPSAEDQVPAVDSKADIITRIQEDLADGIDGWPLEKLRLFEKAVIAFKSAWEEDNMQEVA